MNTLPFLLHAASPLHAGTGQAADLIDLPTAHMKATEIPFVPASSIKGLLRDARTTNAADTEKLLALSVRLGRTKPHVVGGRSRRAGGCGDRPFAGCRECREETQRRSRAMERS